MPPSAASYTQAARAASWGAEFTYLWLMVEVHTSSASVSGQAGVAESKHMVFALDSEKTSVQGSE